MNNFTYADDTTLMAESEEELKSLLMKVKEDSETCGLKSPFRKRMSWHFITSLHDKQNRKQQKQGETLFLVGPKSLQMMTAAMKLKDTCSLEEKLWSTYSAF